MLDICTNSIDICNNICYCYNQKYIVKNGFLNLKKQTNRKTKI